MSDTEEPKNWPALLRSIFPLTLAAALEQELASKNKIIVDADTTLGSPTPTEGQEIIPEPPQ